LECKYGFYANGRECVYNDVELEKDILDYVPWYWWVLGAFLIICYLGLWICAFCYFCCLKAIDADKKVHPKTTFTTVTVK